MNTKSIPNPQPEFYQIKQASETKQLIQVPISPVEKPSAWIQNGNSPTEVILANAVLVMAVSSVIISIAYLSQVLVGSSKNE